MARPNRDIHTRFELPFNLVFVGTMGGGLYHTCFCEAQIKQFIEGLSGMS